MLAKLRIRGKLALIMALPLLTVALLAVPSVVGAMDRAQRAAEIRDSMETASRVASLVGDLRLERQLSLGYLVGVVDRSRLVTQGVQVIDRVSDIILDAEDGTLPGDGLSPPVSAALADVATLAAIRPAVLAQELPPQQMINAYGLVIAGLIDSLRLVDGIDLATAEARQVAALDAALRLNESASQALELLVVVAATQSPEAATGYLASLQRMEDQSNRFEQYATPEQLAQLNLMSEAYIARDETGVGEVFGLDPYEVTAGRSVVTVFPPLESLSQLGRFVETKVITDVLIEVEARERAEQRVAYLVLGGAVLVVLAVVLMTILLARAVIRPLLGLTVSANRVARVADAELARIADEEADLTGATRTAPARITPVTASSQDEIGDLARAFNRVQDTAVRLVERQVVSRRNVALMFAYLGRRTQNLVGRQLSLIDQLEQKEIDSARLSDLYRLDHISSRLSRNAGSLVALSGSVGADEHVAPLPLTDVVRLALGQIEEFGRVDVAVPPSLTVAPAVVGDLVLVLAELMENAATFSPPHTRVAVTGLATSAGAEISIVDHGIGMSAERLAEENARLAHRERLDLAPTEVLGLFVVGRLARRHGLQVTLSATAESGVTAVVAIEQRLLVVAMAHRNGDRPAPASHGLNGLSLEPTLVNLDVLGRASRVLEAGRRWNAFALPKAPPVKAPPVKAPPAEAQPAKAPPAQAQPATAPPIAAPRPATPPTEVPATATPATATPATATPATAAPPAEAPPAEAPAEAPEAPAVPAGLPTRVSASAPVRSSSQPGLRRRVPGATLPKPPASVPASGPIRPAHASRAAAADPDAARSLVEALQDGVARALDKMAHEETRPDPGSQEENHNDR